MVVGRKPEDLCFVLGRSIYRPVKRMTSSNATRPIGRVCHMSVGYRNLAAFCLFLQSPPHHAVACSLPALPALLLDAKGTMLQTQEAARQPRQSLGQVQDGHRLRRRRPPALNRPANGEITIRKAAKLRKVQEKGQGSLKAKGTSAAYRAELEVRRRDCIANTSFDRIYAGQPSDQHPCNHQGDPFYPFSSSCQAHQQLPPPLR